LACTPSSSRTDLWIGSCFAWCGVCLASCGVRLETHNEFGSESVSWIHFLFAATFDSSGGGFKMSMTPLQKSNLRLLAILVLGTVAMTAYWVYFIIAKEPIQP
jgi:EamA domain-containing membrane protein RarD